MVKSFEKRGWKFQDGYWESHHNGTPYYDVEFKSPNMDEFSTIGEHDWPKITEKFLLDGEARHVAKQWSRDVFAYASCITGPIANKLREHFLESNTATFKQLSAEDVSYEVKIADTVKNTPKKIKITIEIL
jgi:hypothetical protein